MVDRLAKKDTPEDEKVMCIQALGNAASTEARKQLQEILMDRTQEVRIRVECVWALRRILPVAREKVSNLGPCVRRNGPFPSLPVPPGQNESCTKPFT